MGLHFAWSLIQLSVSTIEATLSVPCECSVPLTSGPKVQHSDPVLNIAEDHYASPRGIPMTAAPVIQDESVYENVDDASKDFRVTLVNDSDRVSEFPVRELIAFLKTQMAPSTQSVANEERRFEFETSTGVLTVSMSFSPAITRDGEVVDENWQSAIEPYCTFYPRIVTRDLHVGAPASKDFGVACEFVQDAVDSSCVHHEASHHYMDMNAASTSSPIAALGTERPESRPQSEEARSVEEMGTVYRGLRSINWEKYHEFCSSSEYGNPPTGAGSVRDDSMAIVGLDSIVGLDLESSSRARELSKEGAIVTPKSRKGVSGWFESLRGKKKPFIERLDPK